LWIEVGFPELLNSPRTLCLLPKKFGSGMLEAIAILKSTEQRYTATLFYLCIPQKDIVKTQASLLISPIFLQNGIIMFCLEL
jgi:hypothetical protein